ncbi:MBL fold metallo-hydrolase [Persephonella atlantica]|uniref:MBL fold metallo-hydrolase n=1 Tax=Persephonella atlantica TaxID=2699429 RepID=A0ABS1GKA1_9AQUI|nr:MBL fold metallo-hydrolase [Persephonella atlantica]MBK3333344.1 MBL fold metallo-hydrolase [Persephonella atlantica]
MDRILFENKNHRFVLIGFAESKEEQGIPSNQYLIIHKSNGVLLDPGGFGLFPILLSRVIKHISLKKINKIILSHQDPDICGGLNIWMEMTGADVHISRLWLRFLPHYDIKDMSRVYGIPDEGQDIEITSGYSLKIIPAHFLHSPGQVNVYDPVSKILFTGDIGAGLLPCSENKLFVEDFDSYVQCIELFHKRYMASNEALKKWVKHIEKLDINIIAPQHGFLYRGESVEKLIEYLFNLKCGVDLM